MTYLVTLYIGSSGSNIEREITRTAGQLVYFNQTTAGGTFRLRIQASNAYGSTTIMSRAITVPYSGTTNISIEPVTIS